jgi:hypothetical protein
MTSAAAQTIYLQILERMMKNEMEKISKEAVFA